MYYLLYYLDNTFGDIVMYYVTDILRMLRKLN